MSENIICFDMMPTSKIFLTFPVNNETVKVKTKIPNKNPKKNMFFFCFTPIEKLKKKTEYYKMPSSPVYDDDDLRAPK